MSQSQLADAQVSAQISAQATLPVAAGQVGRLSQAVMAMVLGVFVVGMVGFSHIDVVHNAAHDVRHSNAFPCH
ncbi:CbtB-domain containing protein [Bradyrhizobium manausense]|uniref:CbtB domain-containing protein n=1 Tax=Bradyrhizobium manausense TaxID=989370 RepID=UPI001BABCBDA|nr:CbtB-domain containing protein [Bradyrhizobium manausense]MBR0688373.1 CbtB-domain containing protein [Bradyrhizobium manausense]MBR0720969.1 CbtB-domain containing protein [Bradyrhizobium manausense]MBR0833702.1 CbtB-domain containing protein [Bradyrhizobium manausense]